MCVCERFTYVSQLHRSGRFQIKWSSAFIATVAFAYQFVISLALSLSSSLSLIIVIGVLIYPDHVTIYVMMSTVSLFVNAVRFVGRNSSSFLYHIRMQPKKQQQQNPQKSPKSVTIKIEIQPETNEWNIHRAHHLLSLRLELCYIRINSRIKIPSFIWIFISLVCIISDVFFLLSSLTPPPLFFLFVSFVRVYGLESIRFSYGSLCSSDIIETEFGEKQFEWQVQWSS